MRRYAVVITALAVLVAAVVAFLGWRSESQRRARVEARLQGAEARLERIAAQQEEADATAASLVKALGRLCSGFDFFYKHDMARGAFRPVRCSLAGGD
jgi:Flp pilus assembly protein TadB